MTRHLRWLIALALLMLLSATALRAALSSEAVLQRLALALEENFPLLQFDGVQGDLAHGVQIESLRIRAGQTDIALRDATARLHWRCLLWGSVCVDALHIDTLAITTKSSANASNAPPQLPRVVLPFRLTWRELLIERIVVNANDDAPLITQLRSSGFWAGSRLTATQLHGDLMTTRIDISGDMVFDAHYPLDLRVQAQDDARKIRLAADIGGDLIKPFAKIQLEQPARARIDAVLEPFVADLAYRADAALLAPFTLGADTTNTLIFDKDARLQLHGDKHAVRAQMQLNVKSNQLAQPVAASGNADFNFASKQLQAETKLRAGNSVLNADVKATFGDGGTITIDARSDRLDTTLLRADIKGALAVQTTLVLQWQDALQDLHLQRLNIAGDINAHPLRADVQARWQQQHGWNLSRSNLQFDTYTLQANAKGDARSGDATLALASTDAGKANLQCRLKGLDQNLLRAECQRLDWSAPERWHMPMWKNRDTITLSWNRDTSAFALAPLCLAAAGTTLCNEQTARWQLGDLNARIALRNADLAWLNTWLPKGYSAHGSGDAQFTLQKKADAPAQWKSQLSAHHAQLVARTASENLSIPIEQLKATVTSDNLNIRANAALQAGNYGNAQAAIALDKNQQLDGNIRLHDMQLDVLQPLLKDLRIHAGKIDSDIGITGAMATPEFSGTLTLSDGRASNAALPDAIDDIDATLTFAGRKANLAASARMKQSPIKADGTFDLQETFTGNVRLRATELHLKPYRRTDIWISPDITLHWQDGGIAIAGDIAVPRAYIIVKQLPKQGVAESTDVDVIDEARETRSAFPVSGKCKLIIGDAVSFRGFGLQTKLAGNIDLSLSDNQLRGNQLQGNGRVALKDGRYRAYGQLLDIRSGDLIFVGPLDNPVIRIDAIRPDVPEPNVVGVRAEGELRNPSIVLFSTPAMSERARMQYLLTGRAPDSESEASGSILGQALLAYSAGQSEDVVAGVADKFGVRDVSISTADSATGPQVQLSGYLNSRLFLRYGKNVFDNTNEITMRYQLLRNVFVEAVSGVASALDLLWTFEVGGD